uniref:Uncharacterized protein n=1 Tax=Canis lupus familiaris TaxID=9615 RepID=A0A8C0MTF0_CANLF
LNVTFYTEVIVNSFQFSTKKKELILMVVTMTFTVRGTSFLLFIPFKKCNVFIPWKRNPQSAETIAPNEPLKIKRLKPFKELQTNERNALSKKCFFKKIF